MSASTTTIAPPTTSPTAAAPTSSPGSLSVGGKVGLGIGIAVAILLGLSAGPIAIFVGLLGRQDREEDDTEEGVYEDAVPVHMETIPPKEIQEIGE